MCSMSHWLSDPSCELPADDDYSAIYGDGEPSAKKARRSQPPNSYSAGDRLEMRFPNMVWYAGTVARADGTTIDISFDDGDTSSDVPLMVDGARNRLLRAVKPKVGKRQSGSVTSVPETPRREKPSDPVRHVSTPGRDQPKGRKGQTGGAKPEEAASPMRKKPRVDDPPSTLRFGGPVPQETLAAFAAWKDSGVSPSTLTCYSKNLQMLFAGEGGFDSLSGLTLQDVSNTTNPFRPCVRPSILSSCDAVAGGGVAAWAAVGPGRLPESRRAEAG